MHEKKSYYAYVLLLAIIVAAYSIGPFVARNYQSVRLIGWDTLILWALGFAALLFQKQAGFPDLMDKDVKPRHRFWLPVVIGMVFGLADIFVFEVIIQHPAYHALPPFLQPFPYSILLYTSGAVYVEILHRLLPLTLVMLLARKFIPAHYQNHIFWLFAILTSIWEPLEQLPAGNGWLIAYALISGFAFNFLQAIFFKKAGWMASLWIRLGHYLLWHILLGIYVQYRVIM